MKLNKDTIRKISKKITLKGAAGILIVPMLIIPSLILKLIRKIEGKKVWLICENGNTARDNGYVFYEYMKKNHPEIKSYFGITFSSPDYKKVSQLGDCVKWGSLRHYLLFMSADENVTSHKEGEPNHTIFSILHYLGLFNNRTFLQHGVLYHSMPMFYKKKSFFKVFITGAKDEYEMVNSEFGYNNNEVKYTGLARFDKLHNCKVDNKIIALIPTWRRWLDTEEKFRESEYYATYQSLINNRELIKYLEKSDKYIYFYPHYSTQRFIHLYSTPSERIKIISAKDADIQVLIRKASMLITDYSSIFTDFAYMYKPVLFYQFDYSRTYARHYQLDANTKAFHTEDKILGYAAKDEKSLVVTLKRIADKNYLLDKKIEKRINDFFVLNDTNNCSRIYSAIVESNKGNNGKQEKE